MRKFLVVLDDSRECLNAMRFAAMRAAHTGGGVTILSVIPPDEFNHWIGVAEVMREEARERIHAHYEVFAKWMRDKQNVEPELAIREGDPVAQIIEHVQSDPEIGVLVLGASLILGAFFLVHNLGKYRRSEEGCSFFFFLRLLLRFCCLILQK